MIQEMYAWVYWDEGGQEERILGWETGSGLWPLVGPDRDRVEQMALHANTIAIRTGVDVKLVRFSGREELETVTHEDALAELEELKKSIRPWPVK